MAGVTKQYLKRKWPGDHRMHELIDYIASMIRLDYIEKNIETNFFQSAHGFSVGDAVRHNGVVWVRAQANSSENAQTCGVVAKIVDADNFGVKTGGILIEGDWVTGMEYFLSPSVPGLIAPEPESWNIGEVRQSVGWGTPAGLKIEIDVGDEIEELPIVKLTGIWDREFEFCFNAGVEEVFFADRWAVYDYKILEAILECNEGSLQGVSVRINGIPVGGLGNMNIGAIARTYATGDNYVPEGASVTLHVPSGYSGNPSVIAGKLKILRS